MNDDDALRPAAGVFTGLLISLVFWAIVAWAWC